MIRLLVSLWWGCIALAVAFAVMVTTLGIANAEYDPCAWQQGQARANCYAAEMVKLQRAHQRDLARWRRERRLRESNEFTQEFFNQTQTPLIPDYMPYGYR